MYHIPKLRSKLFLNEEIVFITWYFRHNIATRCTYRKSLQCKNYKVVVTFKRHYIRYRLWTSLYSWTYNEIRKYTPRRLQVLRVKRRQASICGNIYSHRYYSSSKSIVELLYSFWWTFKKRDTFLEIC